MTNETIPEPGPARDRLAAKVVGWEVRVPIRGRGGLAFDLTFGYRYPSTENADALAALEAWRLKDEGRRSWQLASPDPDHGRWTVALWWLTDDEFPVSAESTDQPTLPSAATAALLATGEGT